MSLAGKRIIVTGGTRGIGRAIAESCLQAGARVAITYLSAQAEAEALRASYGEALTLLQGDARDAEATKSNFAAFVEQVGGLDGLVNNAGVMKTGLLLKMNPAVLQEQLDVNIMGPLLATQAALPHLMKSKGGSIVNIASVAAQRPTAGQAAYAATKGALESLARAVAVEYGAKQIRCNAIAPGPVQTELTRAFLDKRGADYPAKQLLGELVAPQDVAELACFLLSDSARLITGSVYTIDAGFVD